MARVVVLVLLLGAPAVLACEDHRAGAVRRSHRCRVASTGVGQ
ncbi:MAG: hypothetical protein ACJ79K_09655 [Gemmatimonadaceae bacterium]